MGKKIVLKKGFDIKLAGSAQPNVVDAAPAATHAVKTTDFKGLYLPRPLVQVGDNVKAGSPLFSAKNHGDLKFTSPVSGEVVEVNRGAKRKLLEVRVLADTDTDYVDFGQRTTTEVGHMSKEEITGLMQQSGVWCNMLQRPYGVIANPSDTPKAIHISAFDSHPLAPDYGHLFDKEDQFFKTGVEVLQRLTSGKVHINMHASREISSIFSQVQNAEINHFSGPHPAGCVGVQIHHIDPVNKEDVVWTISVFGVIQLGKLVLNGVFDASRVVALTGSEVKTPQYYRTAIGAHVKALLNENLASGKVRVISGNVLTGSSIGREGHIGFYDHQVTVIPEGDDYDFLGWIAPTSKKLSFHRAFGLLSFLAPKRERVLNANTNGEERAFVMTGIFEKVVPMDVLPAHLLKSILAQDIDEMEALGIYEVIEEDMALCEFVDVSKHEVQSILRSGIEIMQNS